MKRLISLILITLVVSCSGSKQAVVNVSLSNFESERIYLAELGEASFNYIDSAENIDGKFTLTIENTYPRNAYISLSKESTMIIPFVVEAGVLDVRGDAKDMSSFCLSGTSVADKNNELNALLKPYNMVLDSINAQFRTLGSDKARGGEEKNRIYSELRREYNKVQQDMREVINEVVQENTDNLFGVAMLSQHTPRTYEEANNMLKRLSKDLEPNAFTDMITERRDRLESTKEGAQAPDFTIRSLSGDSITLSSLRGQLVLLDFWSYRNRSCTRMIKYKKALYEKYKDRGFTILSISCDDNEKEWRRYVEQHNMPWLHANSLEKWMCPVFELYSVASVPHTILINREGVIVSHNAQGEELEQQIIKQTIL